MVSSREVTQEERRADMADGEELALGVEVRRLVSADWMTEGRVLWAYSETTAPA
jgi:hypothetical protein